MIKKRNYIFLFLFAVVLFTVGIWIAKIIRGEVPYVDQWTRELVEKFDDTYIYTVFRWVTNLGSEPFLVPFTVIMAIILIWVFRDWLPALIFAGGTLISHLFNILIKNLVERERPSILAAANAEGHSFPSGHAMISMVCYGLLSYFIARKVSSAKAKIIIQCLFALIIFLIGISRYVINVHYLTDVAAGFFIGFVCLIVFIFLYECIRKLRTQS